MTGVRDCGYGCVHEAANENLTLQILYGAEKVRLIESSAGFESAVKANLGGFCGPREKENECFDRYKLAQMNLIQRQNQAILSNNTTVESLRDGKNDRVKSVQGKDQSGLMARTPMIPTYQDIQDAYQRNMQDFKVVTGLELQVWQQDLIRAPSKDDFRKWRQVDRDPGRPEAGKIAVKDMSCGPREKPEWCHDEERYQAAMAQYQNKIREVVALMETVTRDRNENPQSYLHQPIARSALTAPSGQTSGVGDESHDALLNARGLMIEAVNRSVAEERIKQEQAQRQKARQETGVVAPGVREQVFGGSDSVRAGVKNLKNGPRAPARSDGRRTTDRGFSGDEVIESGQRSGEASKDIYLGVDPEVVESLNFGEWDEKQKKYKSRGFFETEDAPTGSR